ncbi:MAG: rhodanese-like domain-containing protein [Armatimonadota bacterium]
MYPRRVAAWAGVGASIGIVLASVLGAQAAPRPESASLRAKGETLYATYCARCHGEDGADTTTYAGARSLVDITQRLSALEVIEKSKGFAAVQLDGEKAQALFAHLETFRSGGWAHPELLVETSWLEHRLQDPTVRIVDMRSDEKYSAGHLPGAVRLSEGPLRDANDTADFLPSPEAFAAMMGKAGIGADTHVVIYDDAGGRSAARLWFVLNAYGHPKVSLVNGGWSKWTAEKRPTTVEAPRVAATTFKPKKVPELVCAAPELLARRPDVVVLDTRSADEFTGERLSGGAKKAGRIPNSVNVDWSENVTGPHQVFKSGPELKKLYESKGVTPDKEVVTY